MGSAVVETVSNSDQTEKDRGKKKEARRPLLRPYQIKPCHGLYVESLSPQSTFPSSLVHSDVIY